MTPRVDTMKESGWTAPVSSPEQSPSVLGRYPHCDLVLTTINWLQGEGVETIMATDPDMSLSVILIVVLSLKKRSDLISVVGSGHVTHDLLHPLSVWKRPSR